MARAGQAVRQPERQGGERPEPRRVLGPRVSLARAQAAIAYGLDDGREATRARPGSTGTPAPASAWCTASASPANDGWAGDYDVSVSSNQPYSNATASSATDTYGYETNSSGSAVIYLWYQSPGENITVTVGGATCYTTA